MQLHLYTHPLSQILRGVSVRAYAICVSHIDDHRTQVEFPVLDSRSPLVNHSIYLCAKQLFLSSSFLKAFLWLARACVQGAMYGQRPQSPAQGPCPTTKSRLASSVTCHLALSERDEHPPAPSRSRRPWMPFKSPPPRQLLQMAGNQVETGGLQEAKSLRLCEYAMWFRKRVLADVVKKP